MDERPETPNPRRARSALFPPRTHSSRRLPARLYPAEAASARLRRRRRRASRAHPPEDARRPSMDGPSFPRRGTPPPARESGGATVPRTPPPEDAGLPPSGSLPFPRRGRRGAPVRRRRSSPRAHLPTLFQKTALRTASPPQEARPQPPPPGPEDGRAAPPLTILVCRGVALRTIAMTIVSRPPPNLAYSEHKRTVRLSACRSRIDDIPTRAHRQKITINALLIFQGDHCDESSITHVVVCCFW